MARKESQKQQDADKEYSYQEFLEQIGSGVLVEDSDNRQSDAREIGRAIASEVIKKLEKKLSDA